MRLGTIVVCVMALALLAGCGKSKESYEKSFKESFRKSFATSCAESATKGSNGLKEELAKSKCDCMATYLVTKFSVTELTRLSVGTSTETAKIMEEAINSCK